MTQTHISYQAAKALKEFCPELPEPLGGEYTWQYPSIDPVKIDESSEYPPKGIESYPAYRLEDLLSSPFCEMMAKIPCVINWLQKQERHEASFGDYEVELSEELAFRYTWFGGLPAVEACLMEMIGGK